MINGQTAQTMESAVNTGSAASATQIYRSNERNFFASHPLVSGCQEQEAAADAEVVVLGYN